MGVPAKPANRRDHFRLRMQMHPGMLHVLAVANKEVRVGSARVGLVDLSGGGCQIRADIDLPIRLRVLVEVEFQVLGEHFRLEGELLRKLDDRRGYYYGVTFVRMAERHRTRLIRVLNGLEMERRRQNLGESR